MAWVDFLNRQDFIQPDFWCSKTNCLRKIQMLFFGWPTFFMISVFFNDGNMVSLFSFDLVLSLNKASNLYNYEIRVWQIIRNAVLKYDLIPCTESNDTKIKNQDRLWRWLVKSSTFTIGWHDRNSWKFDSDVIFSADRDTNVSSQKKSGGRRILQEFWSEILFKKQIACTGRIEHFPHGVINFLINSY